MKDDLILGLFRKPLGTHAATQAFFDSSHPLGRALETHRTAEFFGFATAETGRDHRDSQELFLEDRDAERSLENRSQAFVGIDDRFAAGSAIDVGVHHLADDRTRSNDRDLDDEIVEGPGFQARKRRHLCAAFDLEDADRVGATHHGIGLGVVGRKLC